MDILVHVHITYIFDFLDNDREKATYTRSVIVIVRNKYRTKQGEKAA